MVPPCVILAGGRAERLGGIDKCLLPLAGKPLAEQIMKSQRDHVLDFALNANGDPQRFSALKVPVISDREPDCGPLAGVCAAIGWADQVDPDGAWVLIVSGDTPFIPGQLVHLLWTALGSQEASPSIIMPVVKQQDHPLCALWRREQLADLSAAVYENGLRSVKEWCRRVSTLPVELDDVDPGHWFWNINTQEDLTRTQTFLKDQS